VNDDGAKQRRMSQAAWKARLEANRERAAQAKAELEAAKQRKVAQVVAAAGTAYAELNADDEDGGDALRDSTSKLDTTNTFVDDADVTVSAYASDASRYGAAIYADAELDDETRATFAKDDDELLSVGYGQPALSSSSAYDEPDPTQAYDTAPPRAPVAEVAAESPLAAYDTPDPEVATTTTTTAPTALDSYDAPDPTKAVVAAQHTAPSASAAADPYDVPAATPTVTSKPVVVAAPASDGYEAPDSSAKPTPAKKPPAPAAKPTAPAFSPPSDTTSFLARFDKWCDSIAPRGARTSRDWNDEFQRALAMQDSHAKFVALRNLELDFVYAAQLYGKIIISELSLPVQRKTIKPCRWAALLAAKSTCARHSVQVCGRHRRPVQVGRERDEGGVARPQGPDGVLHHQRRRAARAADGADRLQGLPLQAISVLPVSRSTLAYGSCDGARTVHTSTRAQRAAWRRRRAART
jgi:hypothetical protein